PGSGGGRTVDRRDTARGRRSTAALVRRIGRAAAVAFTVVELAFFERDVAFALQMVGEVVGKVIDLLGLEARIGLGRYLVAKIGCGHAEALGAGPAVRIPPEIGHLRPRAA